MKNLKNDIKAYYTKLVFKKKKNLRDYYFLLMYEENLHLKAYLRGLEQGKQMASDIQKKYENQTKREKRNEEKAKIKIEKKRILELKKKEKAEIRKRELDTQTEKIKAFEKTAEPVKTLNKNLLLLCKKRREVKKLSGINLKRKH